jgi:hypothetical protein
VSTAIDETNSNSGSPRLQPGHTEFPAVATLIAKSNGLPLRKYRVEFGGADVLRVAAIRPGQENFSAEPGCEYIGESTD